MAFFSGALPEASCFSAFGGTTPLGSCLILWLHPPLILERLPPVQMKDIIVWSPLEAWVSPTQLEGKLQGWVSQLEHPVGQS